MFLEAAQPCSSLTRHTPVSVYLVSLEGQASLQEASDSFQIPENVTTATTTTTSISLVISYKLQ